MQVILLERVEKLGQMGQMVAVKPGYARNYLLPQKKALRATADNLKYFESQKIQLEAHNLKRRAEAEKVAESMGKPRVLVIRQASEVGHLYGSVRSFDIADDLKKNGYIVDKTQIILENPIKTLGFHRAKLSLHPEVVIDIAVQVARSLEEAEAILEAASNAAE